jgi:hypothetical protein
MSKHVSSAVMAGLVPATSTITALCLNNRDTPGDDRSCVHV